MKTKGFPVQGLVSVLSVVAVLLAWWTITSLGLVRSIILPSPPEVWQGALDIWDGYLGVPFWNHFKASLSVMLMGYFSAALVGVCAGVAMAWIPVLDKLFAPLIAVMRPIPPPAWIPLAILWFGIDLSAKVFIVFVAAVVPCVLNSYQAIKSTPIELLNAGRSLGARNFRLLFEVVIPAGLPVILGGLRIALGTAWATIVAAELVVSLAGFGFLIMNGYRNLESNIVVCGMVAVSVFGFLMNVAFVRVTRRLVPWAEHK
jgi:taurine transport system permease protein